MKRPGEVMDLGATFALASCTKLMTSIAALQCVERHQISLDDDVSHVLRELKTPEIIRGFDEKTKAPVLQPCATSITLRQVMHSSVLSITI